MPGLTADEQRFFETGELQPGMVAAPSPAPAPLDPVALSGLSNAPAASPVAAPAATPVASPVASPAPSPDLNLSDPAELLRRSLNEAQQRVAELEHAVRTAAAAPVAEPPAPDAATDPIGAMFHRLDKITKQMADLQTGLQQTQQQAAQTNTFAAFQQNVQALKSQFALTTPDYDSAVQHLRTARIADLRAFGATDAQIAQQLQQEEFSIANAAITAGKNPAQVMYEMSKRHGYVAKAAPAPGAAPVAAPSPGATLEQIQRAQAAAAALSSQPSLDSDITAEALKAATDTDLNKLVLDPKAWARLVGGDQYPI